MLVIRPRCAHEVVLLMKKLWKSGSLTNEVPVIMIKRRARIREKDRYCVFQSLLCNQLHNN